MEGHGPSQQQAVLSAVVEKTRQLSKTRPYVPVFRGRRWTVPFISLSAGVPRSLSQQTRGEWNAMSPMQSWSNSHAWPSFPGFGTDERGELESIFRGPSLDLLTLGWPCNLLPKPGHLRVNVGTAHQECSLGTVTEQKGGFYCASHDVLKVTC